MTFELPTLPYAYDALEPHIDARTMKIHHTKHHNGYRTKLNNAIEWTDLENKSIEELLSDPASLPEKKQQNIINNGWGYYNHLLFWPSLSPDGGGEPTWELANALTESFWSFKAFKEIFSKKSLTLFGSGWVYLCKATDDSLCIKRYSFQETPLQDGLTPLLGLDVWEHAYYLKYQNLRGEYIQSRWNVVNWNEVSKRLEG
jgi:Fe-Mn family superoxide dismutase